MVWPRGEGDLGRGTRGRCHWRGVDGERVLEAEVEVGVDDRRAFDGAVGVRFEVGEVKQADFCRGRSWSWRGCAGACARSWIATSDEAPVEGGGGVGRGEVPACAGGGGAVSCVPRRARWGSTQGWSWGARWRSCRGAELSLSSRTRVRLRECRGCDSSLCHDFQTGEAVVGQMDVCGQSPAGRRTLSTDAV